MTIDAFVRDSGAGLRIYSIMIDGGITYTVGPGDAIEDIYPVDVAGDFAWMSWLEIRFKGNIFTRYNPRYVVSVDVRNIGDDVFYADDVR